MRVVQLAENHDLVEHEAAQPQPASGEVLVRVIAAGVTPTELLWYTTTHTKSGAVRTRAVPVHEFSGVVAGLGEDVTGLELGQEVYGMNDWFADGALAEYCITQPSSLAPKPARLTHIEAASVPIGALTAWQGLMDRARLQAKERVLVHGGAGSVGLFAVQLAKHRGAHVIATVSARNVDLLCQLGVDQVIDYRSVQFEDAVEAVDVVFDTVGGDTLERSWGLLKEHGRMVTIAAAGEAATDEKTKRAFFVVEPNQPQLIEIGDLLNSGRIRAFVDAVLPLARSSDAFTGKLEQRQGRGKVVIDVAGDGVPGAGHPNLR